MIGRFNYTGRLKITSDKFDISVSDKGNGPEFQVNKLDLAEYPFPKGAKVYIESFRGATYERYTWGTVGELRPALSTSLSEIDAFSTFMFRIKVVDESVEGGGTIIAHADKISCYMDSGEGGLEGVKPILPFKLAEISGVWELSLKEEGVELLGNKRIIGIDQHVKTSNSFAALVFPEICRQVFSYIKDKELQEQEDYPWVNDWLEFGRRLAGYIDEDEISDHWIKKVIQGLISKKNWTNKYNEVINDN